MFHSYVKLPEGTSILSRFDTFTTTATMMGRSMTDKINSSTNHRAIHGTFFHRVATRDVDKSMELHPTTMEIWIGRYKPRIPGLVNIPKLWKITMFWGGKPIISMAIDGTSGRYRQYPLLLKPNAGASVGTGPSLHRKNW